MEQLIYFIYLALVTSTAFVITLQYPNSQNHWLIWVALFTSLVAYGNTFIQRLAMMMLTGLMCTLLAFCASELVGHPLLLALYLFTITLSCVYGGQRFPNYFYILFVSNLFALLGAGFADSFSVNIIRLADMATGTAIAILYLFIFAPNYSRNQLRAWTTISLTHLNELISEIFDCLSQPDYAENIYLFERRIHLRKNKFMQSLCKLRELTTALKSKIKQRITIGKIENLYDIILDCAQILRRVTDHTIFSLCQPELRAIENEMTKMISGFIRHRNRKIKSINTEPLMDAIRRFEQTYQNVMQVTSREPLVFMLFIQGLKAFCAEIETEVANAKT